MKIKVVIWIKWLDSLIDKNKDCLNEEILIDGLRLVGDYLEKSILKPNNINYPLNRLRFLNTFK